jgi:RNA polymerase sigma factor (TIGR02999 family)
VSEQEGRPETGPADALFARVYESLKGLSHRVRSGRAGETLNTTALVHEAFVKLAASGGGWWRDEAHFFAVAARAMRQIVLDAARREIALKRGGGTTALLSYDDAQHTTPVRPGELVALDEALERLSALDPRRGQVVEHRIFAGLSTEETARLLGVSSSTVERDWRAARAWLAVEMGAPGAGATLPDRGRPA